MKLAPSEILIEIRNNPKGSERSLRALLASGALVLAAALGACREGDEVATSGRGEDLAPSAVASLEDAHASADDAAQRARLPRPARGRFAIRTSDAGVSLAANEAPLEAVLEALGAEIGFKVNIGALFSPRNVSIEVADEAIELVLARLLANLPYTLRFELDAVGARTVLAALSVGVEKTRTRPERMAERIAERRESRRERVVRMTPEERAALREEIQRSERENFERQPEYVADLESSDPTRRAEALEGLDIDQRENFERAADLLRSDPNPGVREAAVEALSHSNASDMLPTLVKALDDPDPNVVLIAIDEIAFHGDEALVPHLLDLAENHPDPIVREVAGDRAFFLSD